MKIEVGDLVKNIEDNKHGIVIRVFKSGSIAVLEHIAPMVTNTHDSSKTLEIIEKNSVGIFDENKIISNDEKSNALETLEKAINYDDEGRTRKGNWILGTEGIEAIKIAIKALKFKC